MKVVFIPTGRTEWHGLPGTMRRLFPDHEMHVLPAPEAVESFGERFPYDGFTSTTLSALQEPPEGAIALVEIAAQAALGDRRVEAADLVLVLDDLELGNSGQPEVVTEVFRKAVRKHLTDLSSKTTIQDKTRDALLDRVSFHLLAPMVEALFFCHEAALQACGVPGESPVLLVEGRDPEAFETGDGAYLAATAEDCPAWSALPPNRRRKHRPKWLLERSPRARHPKGYIQWLCRDGADGSCTTYSESEHGGAALAGLDWSFLGRCPDEHLQFARALLRDMEERLGPSTVGPVQGVESPVTGLFTRRSDPVLRNL
ncbi:MAG: hypothetical protein U0441_21900 [Polyangiaceae bacterium]